MSKEHENKMGHTYRLFPDLPINVIVPLFAHRIEKRAITRLESDIEEMKLVENIDRDGIRNPLFAGLLDGVLSIVDGEKRWMCAQKLDIETFPVIVNIPFEDDKRFAVLDSYESTILYVEDFTEVPVE